MAAAQVEPPFERPLYLRGERRVMAGSVRWRTAPSERHGLQYEGSANGRFGERRGQQQVAGLNRPTS